MPVDAPNHLAPRQRPGNAPATRGARGTLIRLLGLLRVAFPRARFLVHVRAAYRASV